MFHILVIDDDKNTRRLMRAVLEGDGYTVTTACDGEEALSVMDREHIDLAVLDIMMPRMDGYEFTKTLRSANNELPILMVSAKQLSEDRKKGFLVGTDDYMTKPVDTDEMLLRIKALLRRAKIVSERKIVVGDVVLDYDSLTVSRGSEHQELPQKEFLLLYKLLSYPARASPASSAWMRSGAWTPIRAGRPSPSTSDGCASALNPGRSSRSSPSGGWAIRR